MRVNDYDSAMKWVSIISLAAFLAAFFTIDAAGNLPTLEGPGITVDESFNIDVGWYIVQAESTYGLAALVPQSQTEIFGFPGYNPDHPPLGRLLLGISDAISRAVLSPVSTPNARWSLTGARIVVALTYALTVFLVGWITWRWCDRSTLAGAAAALVFATTPRVFGHAHIASLESFVGLSFAATVFYLADRCSEQLTPRTAAIAGALWGLTLLTKIQGVLIPIPFAIWGLWHFRTKAIVPGAVFGLVGFGVFFAGWPWLWIDPVNHVLEYFGRGADRIELSVFFAGQSFSDRNVPFFYTVVMFLVTIPVVWLGVMVVGVVSIVGKSRHADTIDRDVAQRRRWQLVFGTAVFVLVFFSLPSIAVYDGVRLFLVADPLAACAAGPGALACWRKAQAIVSTDVVKRLASVRLQAIAVAGVFATLIASGPCWLSHYSLLVGGLPGATALGFETTYWGDSLTRGFWHRAMAEIPRGSTVAVTPVLHQFQLGVLEEQCPAIAAADINLVPYREVEPDAGVEADYLIAFRRRADLSSKLAGMFDDGQSEVLAAESRLGVPLAILVPLDRQDTRRSEQ